MKPPYLINDARDLDREFYSGYDERFLYYKVKALGAILDDPDLLNKLVSEDSGPYEQERIRQALSAEILFTECHQFEAFFAMLVASFQQLPHWIYLTKYKQGDIKKKATRFLEEDFATLSAGLASDRDSFLKVAIYNGIGARDEDQATWDETFENLWWVISRMAKKYVNTSEYNSYKHGLRIMAAEWTWAISSNPKDFSRAFVKKAPYSITHLRLDEKEQGTAVSVERKEFNPDESKVHVGIMSDILGNIKRIRLALLSGGPQVDITPFAGMDKEKLKKLATLNIFRESR